MMEIVKSFHFTQPNVLQKTKWKIPVYDTFDIKIDSFKFKFPLPAVLSKDPWFMQKGNQKIVVWNNYEPQLSLTAKTNQDLSVRIYISNSCKLFPECACEFSDFFIVDTSLVDNHGKVICNVYSPVPYQLMMNGNMFTPKEFVKAFIFKINDSLYAEVMCYANLEKYPCMKEQFEEMARQLVIEKNKK